MRPLSLLYSDASADGVGEIVRTALSLARSNQAERDNESCFFESLRVKMIDSDLIAASQPAAGRRRRTDLLLQLYHPPPPAGGGAPVTSSSALMSSRWRRRAWLAIHRPPKLMFNKL
ncbi:hypothetical protein EVAR_60690_1 [Eumeta japonica]|uniref:Uncharacterized protein n=1 Tax=Eumeta variegata TaxID=151549 RepID=A0A4C1ZKH0_EUMVA|nr:hypothetical protein EVAR_60690_1 [Eumeta japonica]